MMRGLRQAARKIALAPISPGATVRLVKAGILPGPDMRDPAMFDLSRMRSIVVIALDRVGDVVLLAPFLRGLRSIASDARIDLIVGRQVAELAEFCPYVDRVHALEVSRLPGLGPWIRYWSAVRIRPRVLGGLRPDLAIIPRWDVDETHSAFVALFCGASARVGYSERVNGVKEVWNCGYDRLLTHAIESVEVRHEVLRGLDLLKELGHDSQRDSLELWLSEADSSFARALLSRTGALGKELVAFGPAAQAAKRRWPISRYAEVAQHLDAMGARHFIVIGGKQDRAAGQVLCARLGGAVINLAGETTLRQTAALLKHCNLYIGADSGPMHMAAAAGVPVVQVSCHARGGAPLSNNAPERFSAWGVPTRIVRPDEFSHPCTTECTARQAHCILAVGVHAVTRAADELMSFQDATVRNGSQQAIGSQ